MSSASFVVIGFAQGSEMGERVELVQNAAGRMVPAMVNGKPQIPYLGVAKYQPRGRKASKETRRQN